MKVTWNEEINCTEDANLQSLDKFLRKVKLLDFKETKEALSIISNYLGVYGTGFFNVIGRFNHLKEKE